MKSSDTLIAALKKFEGLRLTAYQCAAGVWTIGYGHTRGVKSGDRITETQAEQLLRQDLATFETVVSSMKGIKTQGQFDAVVDFCFNLGVTNYTSSTLRRYIEAGRKTADIQREFLKWTRAAGRQLDGLYSRRIWEAARWND